MPRKYTEYEFDFYVHVDNTPIRPVSVKPKDIIEIHESGEEIMKQVREMAEILRQQKLKQDIKAYKILLELYFFYLIASITSLTK